MTTLDLTQENASQKLLELRGANEEVLLSDGERVFARVVPVAPPKKRRQAGLGVGDFVIADDFDAPLPDSFWLGEDDK